MVKNNMKKTHDIDLWPHPPAHRHMGTHAHTHSHTQLGEQRAENASMAPGTRWEPEEQGSLALRILVFQMALGQTVKTFQP